MNVLCRAAWAVVSASALISSTASAQSSLVALAPPNGSYASPISAYVSDDGNVTAATLTLTSGGTNLGYRVVRWDGTAASAPLPTSFNNVGYANALVSCLDGSGTRIYGYNAKYNGATDLGSRPVRWTGTSGQELAVFSTSPAGFSSGLAAACTPSGTDAVGNARRYTGGVDVGLRAARWDGAGLHELPCVTLSNTGVGAGQAYDISDSGTVVAGYSRRYNGATDLGFRAVRWVNDVPTELPIPSVGPAGVGSSVAVSISGDGSVIAGYATKYSGATDLGSRAVRWASGATTELPALSTTNAGVSTAAANLVTDDGSYVVGYSYRYQGNTFLNYHAVRWNAAGQAEDLGTIGGVDGNSYPADASSDGQIIVGTSANTGAGGTACVWVGGQARSLYSLLKDEYGLDVTGWSFSSATSCSRDGSVIVGLGTFNGASTVFKATTSFSPKRVLDARPLGPSASLYAYYGYLYGYTAYAAYPANAYLTYGFYYAYYAYLYDYYAGQVTYVNQGQYPAQLAIYRGYRYNQAVSSYYAYLYAYYGSTVNYDGTVYYAMLLNYYAFYYGYYDSV